MNIMQNNSAGGKNMTAQGEKIGEGERKKLHQKQGITYSLNNASFLCLREKKDFQGASLPFAPPTLMILNGERGGVILSKYPLCAPGKS